MKVACYWTNDAYKSLADRMMASANAIGLATIGYFRENPAGTWRAGDADKPKMLLRAMQDHPRDSILFVDADCRFLAYPGLLDDATHDHDAAAHFDSHLFPHSTVIWLRAGAGLKYAHRWVEEAVKNPDMPNDMVALRKAFESIRPKRVLHLPPAYCWTEQWMRGRYGSVRPVIEHFAVGEHKFPTFEWPKSDKTIFKNEE